MTDEKKDLPPTTADLLARLAQHEEYTKGELKKIEEKLSKSPALREKVEEKLEEKKEEGKEDDFDFWTWLFA